MSVLRLAVVLHLQQAMPFVDSRRQSQWSVTAYHLLLVLLTCHPFLGIPTVQEASVWPT